MGTLIVIDGLDGSGKNTQSTLLYERLVKEGKRVHLVSFPDYESPACEPVKMYLGGAFGSDPEAVGSYAASTTIAALSAAHISGIKFRRSARNAPAPSSPGSGKRLKQPSPTESIET